MSSSSRSIFIEKIVLTFAIVKESPLISMEMKNKVFEARLNKLEEENEGFRSLKQRVVSVKNRLRDIIAPHENHCRCRTELKLRSSMQRQCNYCARTWCSDNVSSESYRSSYWFFCNHRIGYNVANDNVLKSFYESNDF
ncbi:hypothetical protein KUTeg_013263 [Tegillarca granosa]|uniref:Uncharacterized protein n=1 Tax=Tegillarca granosa TaxID=220873 RepID=A0ABQ9ET66_TEGGR|nr:hypothetical protein KUTeg_013263 [Tegillarca granosa]